MDPALQKFLKLEFRRRGDGLSYIFLRLQQPDGPVLYMRNDGRVSLEFDSRLGWVARDSETGAVAGRPWNDAGIQGQDRSHPPEGE